jgi:hypothetical protein
MQGVSNYNNSIIPHKLLISLWENPHKIQHNSSEKIKSADNSKEQQKTRVAVGALPKLNRAAAIAASFEQAGSLD